MNSSFDGPESAKRVELNRSLNMRWSYHSRTIIQHWNTMFKKYNTGRVVRLFRWSEIQYERAGIELDDPGVQRIDQIFSNGEQLRFQFIAAWTIFCNRNSKTCLREYTLIIAILKLSCNLRARNNATTKFSVVINFSKSSSLTNSKSAATMTKNDTIVMRNKLRAVIIPICVHDVSIRPALTIISNVSR